MTSSTVGRTGKPSSDEAWREFDCRSAAMADSGALQKAVPKCETIEYFVPTWGFIIPHNTPCGDERENHRAACYVGF